VGGLELLVKYFRSSHFFSKLQLLASYITQARIILSLTSNRSSVYLDKKNNNIITIILACLPIIILSLGFALLLVALRATASIKFIVLDAWCLSWWCHSLVAPSDIIIHRNHHHHAWCSHFARNKQAIANNNAQW
jgi:hypothetical protein